MKKIAGMMVAMMGFLALTSCSEKKNDTIIITKKKIEKRPTSHIMSMGNYAQTRKSKWLGSQYTIESRLEADQSLPLAADGDTRYYDNRITLRITRADGSDFLKQSFTKEYFSSYVPDKYYKDGALLGIVFVKAEGNTLVFAASVGNPDKSSDEYVPLVLKIDNFGHVTVTQDTQLDTESTEQQEEEDGV